MSGAGTTVWVQDAPGEGRPRNCAMCGELGGGPVPGSGIASAWKAGSWQRRAGTHGNNWPLAGDGLWARRREGWHVCGSRGCPGLFPSETGSVSSCRARVRVVVSSGRGCDPGSPPRGPLRVCLWCCSESPGLYQTNRNSEGTRDPQKDTKTLCSAKWESKSGVTEAAVSRTCLIYGAPPKTWEMQLLLLFPKG